MISYFWVRGPEERKVWGLGLLPLSLHLLPLEPHLILVQRIAQCLQQKCESEKPTTFLIWMIPLFDHYLTIISHHISASLLRNPL